MVGDQAWIEADFIPTVQKRGAAIIDARGASSAASAAIGDRRPCPRLAARHRRVSWTSMAVRSDGSYGVPEGLVSSFPVTTSRRQLVIVQGLDIDEFSRYRIDATVAELGEERDAVQGLGLVC